MDMPGNPCQFGEVADVRPYRSVVWRGVLAMLVAPIIVIVPVTLAFIAVEAIHRQSFTDFIGICAAVYLFVLRISLPAGVATWIVLRATDHESARNYALAGAVEGLLWALFDQRAGLSIAQLAACAFTALVGAMIAVIFWLIARGRTDRQGWHPAKPGEAS
jgi:hypothetical protein